MGVASWSFDLVWAVGGSGPAGGLLPAESRVAGWCSGVLPVWWVLGWGWLAGDGIGDTPAVVGCWGCCGRGGLLWWVPPLVGGGMLSGFWGSAPWLPDPSGAPDLLGVVGGCGWVGCELYSGREHLTVSLRQVFCRVLLFVFLSVRWMPWHQGPMKDVVACDIPRGAGWRAVIRGFPNGGTRHELCRVTCI